MKIEIKGQPLPKPRMTRRAWYFYKKYWDYLENCALQMEEQKIRGQFEEDIYCKVYFYRKDKRRADIDNLLKTVLELLQKTCIIDNDNQVTEIYSKVEYGSKNPRTIIQIEKICY